MNRALLIGCVVGALAVAWFSVSSLLDNPVEARKRAIEERLSTIAAAEAMYETGSGIEYRGLERAILAKPSLWQPLLRPPQQPAPPPNLEEMLSTVILTRHRMGSGDNVKVKILVLGEGGEKPYWIRKGDSVNGLMVKEITGDYVLFSLMHAGKEQTAKLIP